VIRRRWLALAAIGALLVPACSSALGATPPFCPSSGLQQLSSAIILEAQAVPSARFGPCLDKLEPGWVAHDLQPESGRAWFWLDSDRVGERFLTVTLQEECDTTGAEQGGSGVEGISLYTKTRAAEPMQPFAVITVAERQLAWAQELAGLLRDQGLPARVDASDEPLSERIQAAADAGEIALIVDDADVESRTAAIRTPDSPQDEESGQSLEQILRRFEADENAETLRGEWYLTFTGGCIVYEFDAQGPGAMGIADDVRGALSFVSLEELRESARSAGINI
jgi:hypothetical protein